MAPKPLAWGKPAAAGRGGDKSNVPGVRSGGTFTISGVNGYSFGGLDGAARPPAPVNGLHMVRLGAGSMEWRSLEKLTSPPPARWRHSATLIDEQHLLFFGGQHTRDLRLNDAWVFDLVGLTWERMPPAHLPAAPSASGKADEGRSAAPCYTLPSQETKWRGVPCPRSGHSADLVGDSEVWVFGGYGGWGYGRRDLDDLCILNTATWEWKEKNVVLGWVPPIDEAAVARAPYPPCPAHTGPRPESGPATARVWPTAVSTSSAGGRPPTSTR